MQSSRLYQALQQASEISKEEITSQTNCNHCRQYGLVPVCCEQYGLHPNPHKTWNQSYPANLHPDKMTDIPNTINNLEKGGNQTCQHYTPDFQHWNKHHTEQQIDQGANHNAGQSYPGLFAGSIKSLIETENTFHQSCQKHDWNINMPCVKLIFEGEFYQNRRETKNPSACCQCNYCIGIKNI